jgi:hypothetical protein
MSTSLSLFYRSPVPGVILPSGAEACVFRRPDRRGLRLQTIGCETDSEMVAGTGGK